MIRVLLAVVGLLVAGELFVIAPYPAVAAIVVVAAGILLPGVVLARMLFAAREPSGIAAWLIGPALGLGFGVFGIFLLWSAGVQNWFALLLGPLLTWLIAVIAFTVGGPTLRLPVFFRRDAAAALVLLTLVPAITWAPYDHVREPTADGEAYRAYFTADFIWAMTVASELSKGEVPPVNPFLKGTPLRYYWMSHFLSGALYRNVARWGITVEQVLLITGLLYGLVAVSFLYGLARVAGATPAFAAIAVTAAFVANSYEGTNRLWVLYREHQSLDLVRDYNIDAVTRWFYQGMPVDGLQRMLLSQPHHLTGYMLALSALWLVGLAEDVTEISVALWTGILLGLGLLFSTFTAILVGTAAGILYALRLIGRGCWSAIWQCAALAMAPLTVGIAATMVMGYTDPQSGSLMIFGSNPVALRRWPLMLFLSFGPLLIAGGLGLLRVRWAVREGAAATVLVATALAFYFLVDVVNQEGVWVGWRAGHLLFIAFTVIGASALTAAWRYRAARLPLTVAMMLAIAPALPTVAIDVFNAQDIGNRDPGPGFPWTTIITPPEREALEWLRRTTPPDAVVQMEPDEREGLERLRRSGTGEFVPCGVDPRHARTWGYVTAFAERRMAAGVVGAMIPLRPYQLASNDLRDGIFRAQTAEEAHQWATFLGIDYLLIGPVERRMYRPTILKLLARPDLFREVFRNEVITIAKVDRTRDAVPTGSAGRGR